MYNILFRREECLTVDEALELYTSCGAYTAMQDNQLGRLLPGYQADFVLLDTDICQHPQLLLTTKILQVWVAGKRRF